jgi:hypothetical protein
LCCLHSLVVLCFELALVDFCFLLADHSWCHGSVVGGSTVFALCHTVMLGAPAESTRPLLCCFLQLPNLCCCCRRYLMTGKCLDHNKAVHNQKQGACSRHAVLLFRGEPQLAAATAPSQLEVSTGVLQCSWLLC